MTLARVVAAETLDHLPEDDPAAQRSRRDLRRVHRAMGTRGILRRALPALLPPSPDAAAPQVLELGAGDGSLMLGVASAGLPGWTRVALTLLDRQRLLSAATAAAYARAGWTTSVLTVDVADWAAAADRDTTPGRRWDLIVANLFLHHFEAAALRQLLAAAARRCDCFHACEPRRGRLALAASHLVGVLGANAVTRDDAVLSVHAGFRGDELSAAWPERGAAWRLREGPAGLFSHLFAAERQGGR